MTPGQIEVSHKDPDEFRRRNPIRQLALFGSVLTERFSDSSDVDVLVEFQPGARVGYLRMAAMERELSGLFGGRTVDLQHRANWVCTSATKFCAQPRFSMPPRDLFRLRHMLEASREAAALARGKDRESLKGDRVPDPCCDEVYRDHR